MSTKLKSTTSQGHSPIPATSPNRINLSEKNGQVDFPEAMRIVINGGRITRTGWNDHEIYGILRNNRLQIFLKDGLFHDWLVSDGDLFANDWIGVSS